MIFEISFLFISFFQIPKPAMAVTNRDLPKISKLNFKHTPTSSTVQLANHRRALDQLHLDAYALAKQFTKFKDGEQSQKKLRKVFNKLMVLIKTTLCDRFGDQLGMQLAEKADRLVYLFETTNETLCEGTSCNHSNPEYKVLIYECMRKKQHQWNQQKKILNQAVIEANAKIQDLYNRCGQKLKTQQIVAMNEKLRLKQHYQKRKFKEETIKSLEQDTEQSQDIQGKNQAKRINKQLNEHNVLKQLQNKPKQAQKQLKKSIKDHKNSRQIQTLKLKEPLDKKLINMIP